MRVCNTREDLKEIYKEETRLLVSPIRTTVQHLCNNGYTCVLRHFSGEKNKLYFILLLNQHPQDDIYIQFEAK